MKAKLLFLTILLGAALTGCGDSSDSPAVKEFRKTMMGAHTRISAREAFAMPDLVQTCVIPEYESIASFSKLFGIRKVEKRLLDAPSIQSGSVGLLAVGKTRQSYLVLDMLEDDSVKVLNSTFTSGCFEGSGADFIIRPSGFWQIEGKKTSGER